MTGQVKEEILTRFGELGVRVDQGTVGFQPVMLRRREFLEEALTFAFFDVNGETGSIEVPAGRLVFTVCQVPVVYEMTDGERWIQVVSPGGTVSRSGNRLESAESRSLFDRAGVISRIHVGVPRSELLDD
jgi:hypothetical protein